MTGDLRVVIVAGPNGAGKTTYAREILPHEANCPIFVNADLIAEGLSPLNPQGAQVRAARIMLEELDRHFAARESFAFETTLSGRAYLHRIAEWQAAGYLVELVFLSLPKVEDAIERVATRVKLGGHHVPEDLVRRRFALGLRNLKRFYAPVVDSWVLYDNYGEKPVEQEWGEKP